MNEDSIKKDLREVIGKHKETDYYDLRRLFEEVIVEFEIEQSWEMNDVIDSWTDDELRIILTNSPTKDNCLKYARALKRGYHEIAQVYIWANESENMIRGKRPDHAAIAQIKRIAKQFRWRVPGDPDEF